jgi:hypothetical protein
MKRDQKAKMNLNLNPITGLPNENKRYYYPKADETEAASEEEPENCSEIDDAKIAMVLERLRWKGARRIRGYKYKGTIPEPKSISDYLPWQRED